eukprot:TRINITY_DN2350_c0_g1_i2.p1 TRINITY_DN2350_c0_g1~~TRINITY_DN2350_c0_g1_i2.p1  ORF type:complete len:457 (-),score=62.80 TRINITY_DN2350_c0_g1_i2:49-1323(-)
MKVIFLLVAIFSCQIFCQSCTQDYQCNIPYGQCIRSNQSTSAGYCSSSFPGIAIDQSNAGVYYALNCFNSASPSPNDQGNITIRRADATNGGGSATTVFSQQLILGYGNIQRILAAENGVVYYDRAVRPPGTLDLYAYNVQSGLESKITLIPGLFQGYLDIATSTYTCQLLAQNNMFFYDIVRFAGVVGQTGSSTNAYAGTILYSLGNSPCGPLRRGVGSDIIFTAINYTTLMTTFYRGIIMGSDNALPSPYFTVNGVVNDFDVASNGAIVYGTSAGLFKREGNTITNLYSETAVTGVSIFDRNQIIFFNNGVTVRAITLQGQIVQPNNNTTSVCQCKPGFSGNNCQTCINGQIQWNNNNPSCVSYGANGLPVSCSADYQCGNVPFTLCTNQTCVCRNNFRGIKCDICDSPRTLTWRNGIPYCE